MSAAFTVLAVCTGNVCRSPVVERLLAERLGPSVAVRSAGTRSLAGEPVNEHIVALLHDHGGSEDGFTARQLDEAHLRGSQLVLALTRQHRAAVVELLPGAVRRSFTLREFARIASHVSPGALTGQDPGERLARLVPLAAASRTRFPAAEPGADDVVDPYGRDEASYRQSMDQIVPAVAAIVAAVT